MLWGMADARPEWHLTHTTWFFDRFLLQGHLKDYAGCDRSGTISSLLLRSRRNRHHGHNAACSAAQPSERSWPGDGSMKHWHSC